MLRCLPLLKACNQQVDYIDKRHCGLGAIPDDILQYYHSLEELLLDGNQIKDLPRVSCTQVISRSSIDNSIVRSIDT